MFEKLQKEIALLRKQNEALQATNQQLMLRLDKLLQFSEPVFTTPYSEEMKSIDDEFFALMEERTKNANLQK